MRNSTRKSVETNRHWFILIFCISDSTSVQIRDRESGLFPFDTQGQISLEITEYPRAIVSIAGSDEFTPAADTAAGVEYVWGYRAEFLTVF
jgi:hypothetical protein